MLPAGRMTLRVVMGPEDFMDFDRLEILPRPVGRGRSRPDNIPPSLLSCLIIGSLAVCCLKYFNHRSAGQDAYPPNRRTDVAFAEQRCSTPDVCASSAPASPDLARVRNGLRSASGPVAGATQTARASTSIASRVPVPPRISAFEREGDEHAQDLCCPFQDSQHCYRRRRRCVACARGAAFGRTQSVASDGAHGRS